MSNTKKSVGLGNTVIDFPNAPRQTQTPPVEPEVKQHQLDLVRHLPDCLVKRYVTDVSKMCWIPISTTFLIGIGSVSGVACRVYSVAYPDGTSLPIGEYVVGGQPPGTGKSRMLKAFCEPIHQALGKAIREQKKREKDFYEQKKESDDDNDKPFPERPIMPIFATDGTAEGIDKALDNTDGFFALASAEQAIINSLMGASYKTGSKNNNDVALKGFNGEYHSTTRANRTGYTGNVIGAITCFAQPETIETILSKSEGSGLAERFLMVVEPDFLGQRDHEQFHRPNQNDSMAYHTLVGELADLALEPFCDDKRRQLDNLPKFRLSDEAWTAIRKKRNELEPLLAEGKKYSVATMRGMASKIDIHILKMATILAILDGCKPNLLGVANLPDVWVTAAINIMDDLLDYAYSLLVEYDVIGFNAYENSIIEYLGNKGTATRKQIQQSKTKAKPWSEITPKSAIGQTIRSTIDDLIAKGIVSETETFNADGNSNGRLLRLIA